MLAIIQARCSSSRLPGKVLRVVAGKPVIEYILDRVLELGISEVILVISPSGGAIKKFVEKNYDFKTHYILQPEPLGIGHAIHQCRFLLENEPITIILGDVIYLSDFSFLGQQPKQGMVGVKTVVENLDQYGLVRVKSERITSLVEKPDYPFSNLAIAGIYYFPQPKSLMVALEKLFQLGKKTRNEYQLTDALQLLVDQGEDLLTFEVEESYDCGTPEKLLEANRRLLDLNGKDYEFPGSVIIPPVNIAKGARIEKSVVGPHVAISGKASVTGTIVRDAIIGMHAKIENCKLRGSIIIPDTILTGVVQESSAGRQSEVFV